MLKEKLQGLKVGIKGWHKDEYGELEEEVRRLVEEIVDLDNKGEECCWSTWACKPERLNSKSFGDF